MDQAYTGVVEESDGVMGGIGKFWNWEIGKLKRDYKPQIRRFFY